MAKSTQTPSSTIGDLQPKLAKGAKALQATAKKEARKRKPHGNSKFSEAKWTAILECVATYGDLIEACDKPDMPSVITIYRWMRENPDLKDDMRQAWDSFTMIGNSVNNNILTRLIHRVGSERLAGVA